MITLLRTNSDSHDFVNLVAKLDEELAERDGKDHSFYAPFNTITQIKHALVAYDHDKPTGCGAIKVFSPSAMEVKRMYVVPERRGAGIAASILAELEKWSVELGHKSCVLETGRNQPEAIRLYTKTGYSVIPNYGQYQGIENSVCFEKKLV